MTLQWPGRVKSRDNLKSLYLHYHSAYGHQTWQTGDLPWGASTHNDILTFCLVRLPDKLKALYLHYYNIYGHKTRQDDDVPWLPFTHKVKWTLIMWFCEITYQPKKNYLHYQMVMTTKRGRMMAYLEWFLLIKSHDHIITWSFNITWRTIKIIYPSTLSMTINFGRSSFHKGVPEEFLPQRSRKLFLLLYHYYHKAYGH